MKESRLIVSILAIVFSLIVSIQSYHIWMTDIIENEKNEEILQIGGILAFCMFLAGLIGIVCRKNKNTILFCSLIYLFGLIPVFLKDCDELFFWAIPNLIFCCVCACTGFLQRENTI